MTYTIVVGVNDSMPARAATGWAAARAAKMDGPAELTLVHVMEAVDDLPTEAIRRLKDVGEALLAEIARSVTRSHPTVMVRTDLRHGDAIEELSSVAVGSDLMVVGTHKTGVIQGRSIGSRSLRIAAEAHLSVVVVPESSRGTQNGIIVGVDESEEGIRALEFAAGEAERTGQELTLIRAWDAPRSVGAEFEITVGDLAQHYAANAERVLAHTVELLHRGFPNLATKSRRVRRSAAEALLDGAASASLLVVGSTHLASRQSPLGEIGHDVLLNILCPTVLVHAPAAADTPPHTVTTLGIVSE